MQIFQVDQRQELQTCTCVPQTRCRRGEPKQAAFVSMRVPNLATPSAAQLGHTAVPGAGGLFLTLSSEHLKNKDKYLSEYMGRYSLEQLSEEMHLTSRKIQNTLRGKEGLEDVKGTKTQAPGQSDPHSRHLGRPGRDRAGHVQVIPRGSNLLPERLLTSYK